jgi:hypothetical protein
VDVRLSIDDCRPEDPSGKDDELACEEPACEGPACDGPACEELSWGSTASKE